MKDGGESETKLIFKDLENTFKLLFDGDKRWEALLQTTEKAVESHNYLLNQLNSVKRYQCDTKIEKDFPHLKGLLISKISLKISEEIQLLETVRKECKKILENIQSKREKIISLILKLESPCPVEIIKCVGFLEEALACLTSSYLMMSAAVAEAEALEEPIPKVSYSYPPSQRGTMDRISVQWRFYSECSTSST